MKIGQVDVVPTAKAVGKDFMEDDVQGLAAEAAYHILFSVVPLLIFVTALSGFIGQWYGEGDASARIITWLQTDSSLPNETVQAVISPIQKVINNQSGGFLSLGALLALWSGKNAIASLMKALNVAYDVKETRPWWKKTLIAMGLTVALGLAIISSSAFFLVGSAAGDTISGWIGLGDTWTTVWGYLRWPLIALLLAVALAFFYWAGPNVNTPFKWLTPGAILTVILWGIASFGLGIYFTRFAGYLETYGVLGGLLAFIFWLYVMTIILLVGGEINSFLARELDPDTQAQVADPEKRPEGASTKRRAAARGEANASGASRRVTTARVTPPLPARPTFPDVGQALPSAERQARATIAEEGSDCRHRRYRTALTALGAAGVAAVSGALVGVGRR